MTSQRIPIPCPSCGRYLQIRAEKLGRKGTCQHCGHRFRAESELAAVAAAAAAGRGAGRLERRLSALESEFQGVLSHLTSQSEQQVAVFHELQGTSKWPAQVQQLLDRNPARSSSPDARPANGDGGNPFAWGDMLMAGSFADPSGPLPQVEFNPELDELEEQFEAGREALSRDLERLRNLLHEAELSHDATRAEHARDRLRWEEDRRRLEADRDSWKREAEALRAQADRDSDSSLCFSCLSHPEG